MDPDARIQKSGCRVPNSESGIQNPGFIIEEPESGVEDTECRNQTS
jgi:hypothetical protein